MVIYQQINGHKQKQEINSDQIKGFHPEDLKRVVTQKCSGSSGLVDFQGPTNKASSNLV